MKNIRFSAGLLMLLASLALAGCGSSGSTDTFQDTTGFNYDNQTQQDALIGEDSLDQDTCTPDCDGRVCGTNGCGGTCGKCEDDFQCDEAGQCVEPPVCGDGTCNGDEACTTCPEDCGSCDPCGNGTCDQGETCTTCPEDCECDPCGDGSCDLGETCANCPADCGECTGCGNGSCQMGETCTNCPEDCGPCPTCGDDSCDQGETCTSCPEDCGQCDTCPNGACDGDEDCETCPQDCGQCQGECTEGETKCAGDVNLEVCENGEWSMKSCNQVCVDLGWAGSDGCGDVNGDDACICSDNPPEVCEGWTCDPTYFAAGDGCDCDCGCWDLDCDDPEQEIYGCDQGQTCVQPGVCDQDQPEVCEGWICDPIYYKDGDGCDCDCGCWDPDCEDPNQPIYGCEQGQACAEPGICQETQVETCEGWTCNEEYFGAGDGCDCNCGCWDPDCDDSAQQIYGCEQDETCVEPGLCQGQGQETCDGWLCDPLFFGAADGCDCNCGCWDPDCDDPAQQIYGCEQGEACVQPGECGVIQVEVCEGWTCNPDYYGAADGCDCACGCWDPDCDDSAQQIYGCEQDQLCVLPGVCEDAPIEPCEGWTCDPTYFGDGEGCDCDCGCRDTDCNNPDQEVLGCGETQFCNEDGACEDLPLEVCVEWTCDSSYFAAGDGCDCDCGCWDPDCADPAQEIYNCEEGELCNLDGLCVTPGPVTCETWTCDPNFYGSSDGCDCNCGCWDPDCDLDGQQLYGCEQDQVCVEPGLCEDPAPQVCEGWTCNVNYYGAADGCDCNCGCWDPDCDLDGQQLFGCEQDQVCVEPGLCQDPAPQVCEGWTCNVNYYGAADGCDCDCGCWDPDCDLDGQQIYGCEQDQVCVEPGLCQDPAPQVCEGWTCNVNYFAAGDGCDCECGCWDPDCDDPNQRLYGCDQDQLCVQPGTCLTPGPVVCEGWTCNPEYYGAGDGCDCECGCWDLDCDDLEQAVYGCDEGQICEDPGICEDAPVVCEGWTCDPTYYNNNDGCDCDCGCWDPDCDDPETGIYNCADGEICLEPGVCAEPSDTCIGWTCDPSYFAAGDGCDCNCGCYDTDCDDPEQSVWGCSTGETCVEPGVCQAGPVTCEGWTCNPDYYGAGDGCDCDCGCYDSDCDDPEQSIYGCTGDEICVEPGVCQAPATTCTGWTCNPDYYGAGDGCDCDCGCYDTDCNDPEQSIYGCTGDEICVEPGVCQAPATTCEGWTCNPDFYGAGDGCDCDCGCYDTDCDDPEQSIYGCADDEICVEPGVCASAVCEGWTCNPDYYNDNAGCDCDCGCWDPDCDDPEQTVYGCFTGESCIEPGVCI